MFELSPQYYIKRRPGGRCGIVDRSENIVIGYYFDNIKCENSVVEDFPGKNYFYYTSEQIAVELNGKWCLTTLQELIDFATKNGFDR